MNSQRLPTIVGLMFLVVGLITGVFLVQQRQYFRLSASNEYSPNDVRITNITDTSFTVSFYTNKDSLSGLNWGTKSTSENFKLSGDTVSKKLHYITVADLDPNSTYFFSINSGGQEFNNNGIPWTVTTSSIAPQESTTKIISGRVFTKNNQPAESSIVYLKIGGASPISTHVSKSGTFVIPLHNIRDQTLSKFQTLSEETLINIVVQAGDLGLATADARVKNSNPLPDLILGKSYDFKNLIQETEYQLPEAEINLPDNEAESRFDITSNP